MRTETKLNIAVAAAVALLAAAFKLSAAPTVNEDYVDAQDAQTYTNALRDAKAYTDRKVAAAEPGNYQVVSNKAMTAVQDESDPTVPAWAKEPTSPAPGNYAAVSNKAMTAVQVESDPTVPAWAKEPTSPAPGNYAAVSNKAMTAVQVESDPTVPDWAKAANPPSAPVQSVNGKTGEVALDAGDVGAATVQQMNETRAIVQTWEGFLDGSNVVFSITNYLSGAYQLGTAKLKIMELRDGQYREVYNSRDEIIMHLGDFETNNVNPKIAAFEQQVSEALADKADRDWGKYTSAGGVAPSNTVYMTAPSTVFAGGMEYERVAVGEGALCVLTTKGAPVYTQGDEGTFKFQDDGGTNYFGFAKTDSYTIGCNTDGISVQDHVVTLTYNVTMSGVPCIWYCPSLDVKPIVWEQLNTPGGQPIAGASHVVTWDDSPAAGSEVCYLNCPEPKGFFKATIEVAGSAKFMTNMPADFSGGVICTDGITVIYPHADGTWSTTK